MNKDSHSISRIEDCKLITLDKHTHANGSLSVVENSDAFPFEIKRVYYLYDLPGGAERGGHSHYNCHRFIVAVSGCFDNQIDEGVNKNSITLNRSNIGLHIVPGIWLVLKNFSSGSVCLAIASEYYDAEDYVRDYEKFLELTKDKRK